MSESSYLLMLNEILTNGTEKTDRTGTGTRSLFGYQLRFDMKDGFPLITTKYVNFKNVAVELLWFLSGSTNIKPLVDQYCNIWVDWPYKRFCQESQKPDTTEAAMLELWNNRIPTRKEFIESIKSDSSFGQIFGELGPVYGSQWRRWTKPNRDVGAGNSYFATPIDQIAQSIEMLKTSPDSRRNIVSAWNVADIPEMAISGLPPCHFAFQWNTRPMTFTERLDYLKSMTYNEILALNENPLQMSMLTVAQSVVYDETQGSLTREANLDVLGVPRLFLDVNVSIRSH